MQRPRLKSVYFYGHGTKGVIVSASAGCSSCSYDRGFRDQAWPRIIIWIVIYFLWHKTKKLFNLILPSNYLQPFHVQTKTGGSLTSLANSCRVLKLTFPPKPLRRPTMNWPLSVTALRCDRPFNIVPTTLVSTTKSFLELKKKIHCKI